MIKVYAYWHDGRLIRKAYQPKGRPQHDADLIARVCELIEEHGFSFAQTAKALGLTRFQVKGIAYRNGAHKGESCAA